MKKFFEEYGFIILGAVVVIILIGLTNPLGAAIEDNVLGISDEFNNNTNTLIKNMNDKLLNNENNELIKFYVTGDISSEMNDGCYYVLYAPKNMTWDEFVHSEYNDIEIENFYFLTNSNTYNGLNAQINNEQDEKIGSSNYEYLSDLGSYQFFISGEKDTSDDYCNYANGNSIQNELTRGCGLYLEGVNHIEDNVILKTDKIIPEAIYHICSC